MIEYKVVGAFNIDRLNEKVNEKLAEGFDLRGSPFIRPAYESEETLYYPFICQAMTKKIDDDHQEC